MIDDPETAPPRRQSWKEQYAALLESCADAAFRDLCASGSRGVYVTYTKADGRAWGILHLEGADLPSSGRPIACRLDASMTREQMIAELRRNCGRLPLLGETPCDRVFSGPVDACALRLDHPGKCKRPTPAPSSPPPACRPRYRDDDADRDFGGAFDGFNVHSDADPGL